MMFHIVVSESWSFFDLRSDCFISFKIFNILLGIRFGFFEVSDYKNIISVHLASQVDDHKVNVVKLENNTGLPVVKAVVHSFI